MFVGIDRLFGDERAQEIQDPAQRSRHLVAAAGMQDIPFPVQELLQHGWRKSHQSHEDSHRKDAREIPGDIDFACCGELLHHFACDAAHVRFHPVEPRRRKMRHQEVAILAMLGGIDRERYRAEGLPDDRLELGRALVREMLVVGIDPVDVVIMSDHPGAFAAAR